MVRVEISAKYLLTKSVKVTGNQFAITFNREDANIMRLKKGQTVVLGIIEVRDE